MARGGGRGILQGKRIAREVPRVPVAMLQEKGLFQSGIYMYKAVLGFVTVNPRISPVLAFLFFGFLHGGLSKERGT